MATFIVISYKLCSEQSWHTCWINQSRISECKDRIDTVHHHHYCLKWTLHMLKKNLSQFNHTNQLQTTLPHIRFVYLRTNNPISCTRHTHLTNSPSCHISTHTHPHTNIHTCTCTHKPLTADCMMSMHTQAMDSRLHDEHAHTSHWQQTAWCSMHNTLCKHFINHNHKFCISLYTSESPYYSRILRSATHYNQLLGLSNSHRQQERNKQAQIYRIIHIQANSLHLIYEGIFSSKTLCTCTANKVVYFPSTQAAGLSLSAHKQQKQSVCPTLWI